MIHIRNFMNQNFHYVRDRKLYFMSTISALVNVQELRSNP